MNETSGTFEKYIQGMIGFIPSTSPSPDTAHIDKALNMDSADEGGTLGYAALHVQFVKPRKLHIEVQQSQCMNIECHS